MLRSFNETGLEVFRSFLAEAREGNIGGFSDEILSSPHHTNPVAPQIQIERINFPTKKEMAVYLHGRVSQMHFVPFLNVGLWTWLAAFYIDVICPVMGGSRKVLEESKYVLNTEDWRKYHRHLIAAPVRLYSELGDLANIYLVGLPYKHGDMVEQLASRQEIAASRGIIEAATILYWDDERQKIRRGATNHKGPGVLRRFAKDLIPQFQMTYDLNSMSGEQIVDLLPEEFHHWLV